MKISSPPAAVLVAIMVGACAGPGRLLDLADAASDDARVNATREAARVVEDPQQSDADRVAAALSLGRLRRGGGEAVKALARALRTGRPEIADAAAWALGELRTEASLEALVQGLGQASVDREVGNRLLEGIAKHHSLLSGRPERVVPLAEAMSRYVGRIPDGRAPPLLDLIGARVRTLEVDVEVLALAARADAERSTPTTRAALYSAAFELLARLDRLRAEVGAGGRSARAEEAIAAASAVLRRADGKTSLMIQWFLGVLADEEVYARAVSAALAGAGRDGAGAGARLVRAWGLARAQGRALDARRALARDVLLVESSRSVLRTLAGAVPARAEEDILQRALGLEARP